MDKAKAYIDEHKERFVGELFELLRIPSVSALSVSSDSEGGQSIRI